MMKECARLRGAALGSEHPRPLSLLLALEEWEQTSQGSLAVEAQGVNIEHMCDDMHTIESIHMTYRDFLLGNES